MGIQQMLMSGAGETFTVATGGTIATSGDWKRHTFTSSGTFTVSQAGTDNTIEYLIVAAGGIGGGYGNTTTNSGGGGGGGVRSSVVGDTSGGGASAETAPTITASSYTITIGTCLAWQGSNGGPSSIAGMLDGSSATITALGGGYGYGDANPAAWAKGGTGGSGGGSGNSGSAYQGSGTAGQGHDGYHSGGGGGGAGGAATSGTGGVSLLSNITPSGLNVSAGGNATGAAAGTANTGNGGGGSASGSYAGGTGGSGIIIIRYKYQ